MPHISIVKTWPICINSNISVVLGHYWPTFSEAQLSFNQNSLQKALFQDMEIVFTRLRVCVEGMGGMGEWEMGGRSELWGGKGDVGMEVSIHRSVALQSQSCK